MAVRKIITAAFALIMAGLSLHLYARIYYSAGNGAVYASIVMFLVPVIVAAGICFIRKKDFHYPYWICVTSVIVILNVVLFFAFLRPAVKSPRPDPDDVNNYFRSKKLFSRHFFLHNAYEYPEAYYPTAYIAKTVYRLGGTDSKDLYIGKVLIGVNGKVIKEYYNQPASKDPALVRKDFGKSGDDLKWILPLFEER